MLTRCIQALATSCLLVAGGVPAARANDEPPKASVVAAWRQISMLDYAGAEAAFVDLLEKNPADRHARLGLAIARLNRPPKTNGRTAAFEAEMEAVRAANPDDELGIMAAYQIARLHQVHFHPANLAEARRRYEELHRAHPGHYFGQMALLRVATIDLFSQWPPADPEKLIAAWEARREEFVDPVIRRNFLRKLGDAILWFGLPEKRALPSFVEANEIGFSRFDMRALMFMKVYTISVDEGMPELTRAVAEQYLKEYPRDLWSQFMREKLAALDAGRTP